MLTMIDVRNGSATPSVIGWRRSGGSARFSQWISWLWNAKATPKEIASASSESASRLRSSPRCSTSVASSP